MVLGNIERSRSRVLLLWVALAAPVLLLLGFKLIEIQQEVDVELPAFDVLIEFRFFVGAGILEDLEGGVEVAMPALHFSPSTEDGREFLDALKVDLRRLLEDDVCVF